MELVIIPVACLLGLSAIILAFLPRQQWPMIPISPMMFGLSVYAVIGFTIGKFLPTVVPIIISLIVSLFLTIFVVNGKLSIDFIRGFCCGICLVIIIIAASQILPSSESGILKLLILILAVIIIGILLIYWSSIKRKMENNFEKSKIILAMVGVAWIGLVFGFVSSRLMR